MSQFDFEPDYETWWNKGNLSYDELCWLLCGLNPAWGKKRSQPRREISLEDTDEDLKAYRAENQWRSALEDFLHHRALSYPEFMPNLHDIIRKNIPFLGCKKDFINRAHACRIPFPKKFEDYLNSIDAFIYDDKVKHYMNHKNFCIDIKNINLKDIDNTQDAFAILMGLDAESLQRYLDLNEIIINVDENTEEQILLNDDDRWFHSEYENFTRAYFYDGDIDVVSLYQQYTDKDIWNGHFDEYAAKLYNNGIVFRCDIQEALKDCGISLDYKTDSWVYRFYHAWYEKRAWTFREALFLFKGYSLDMQYQLVDLRQNSWLLNLDTQSIWNAMSRQQLCLKDLVQRHVAISSDLEEFRYQDHIYYKPEQITLWLCENTHLLPPPILVDIVFSASQKEQFHQSIDDSINKLAIIHDNLNAEKQRYIELNEPEKCRQLIQDILPFWEHYTACYKEEPTMHDVMQYLISHNPSLLVYKNRNDSSLLHAIKKGSIVSAFEKYIEEKARLAG